jgi:hypothetical protein
MLQRYQDYSIHSILVDNFKGNMRSSLGSLPCAKSGALELFLKGSFTGTPELVPSQVPFGAARSSNMASHNMQWNA